MSRVADRFGRAAQTYETSTPIQRQAQGGDALGEGGGDLALDGGGGLIGLCGAAEPVGDPAHAGLLMARASMALRIRAAQASGA